MAQGDDQVGVVTVSEGRLHWRALNAPGGPEGRADVHQPDPKPGREVVADYVLEDIQARVVAGEQKYGTKLMSHNGRDPLWDAYQEALDLVFYLRQAILEREAE